MSSTINQDSILSGKVSTQEVPLSGKVSTQETLLSGTVSTLETLIGPPGPRGLGWYQHSVDASNPQIYMWTGMLLAPKWGEGDWLYDPDNGNIGLCTRRTDKADGSGSAGITYKGTLKGTTPHIGENGNWYIGDTDTGVLAGGSKLPAVTAADAGKFLRVSSSGSWVAEIVANANGGEF